MTDRQLLKLHENGKQCEIDGVLGTITRCVLVHDGCYEVTMRSTDTDSTTMLVYVQANEI